MAPWLANLIQTFGRDVITGAPDAAKAVQREVAVMRDPYVDKAAYWFRRGGEAQIDANDHRCFDKMSVTQRTRLAEAQARGEVRRYTDAKAKHRRPWTGAMGFDMEHPDTSRLLAERRKRGLLA